MLDKEVEKNSIQGYSSKYTLKCFKHNKKKKEAKRKNNKVNVMQKMPTIENKSVRVCVCTFLQIELFSVALINFVLFSLSAKKSI